MRWLCLIWSLLISLGLWAQQPRFVNYGAADGLPSNTVYAITQDGDGRLWVGTRGGLSCFDGESFRTVLSGRRITSLATDRENRVWAGSTEGLTVFSGTNRSSSLEGHLIRALLATSDGYVWATVGDSLLLKMSYSPEEGIREEIRTQYSKRYHEGDYPYFQIFEDRDGVLWLGGRIVRTQFIKDPDHPQFQFRYSDTHCTGSYAQVKGVLYSFEDANSSLNTFDGDQIISHGRLPIAHARLLTDSKGRLWAAGSYGLGLVNLDQAEKTVVYKHQANNPSSISSAELYCLFEDRQGNLWVGGDNGLSVLCPALQEVQTLDLPSKQITALLEASDGKFWVGTADDGAFFMENTRPGSRMTHVDYRPAGRPNEGHVSCLYEDSEGTVYIGLYAGCGFNIWKNGHISRGAVSGPIPEVQHIAAWEDRITSNWIMDFMEGRDKRFYVVTWEGVGINEWDRKTGKTAPPEWLSPFWYPTPDKDSSIFLSSRLGSRLIEDAQGNLVYGTTEAGLNIIDKDTRLVTKYLPNPQDSLSLPDNYVTDLCVAPDGTLWVATQRGLWTPSGKSYLRGKLVQSVRADTQGRLWAGTEEGLYFVDTDGSLGVVKKGLGFPSDLYGEKTACVLSDGRLAFGGPEGMALFHPDSLLALKGSDNLLLAPLRKHRYRLNGGRWIESAFAGLPDNMRAGRYILEEQTSDLFGRWNRGDTSVRKLRVPPPLWLRWPFLLLYLLLAVAVLWTFVRLRERRLLMAELDKRNRFFSIISHDLRNPVSGNRMLARELLLQADHLTPQQLKEGIRALSESADKASSLLENLLVWSLNQKGMLKPVKREEDLNALVEDAISSIRGGELIQVDIPEGLSLQTDRNMLLTCLRNLLDNAVKVTPPGGKVTLKARGTRITIADEGPGLKEGTRAWGHGLGLVITRELLEKMGASLQMENRPEGGLEIRIDL